MKNNHKFKLLIPAVLGLTVLVLDSKTALQGAREGLAVCIQTVLPSLFPFIFLSSLLTSSLLSGCFRSNRLLCHLFRIPLGADGILLTGLLGGYPVGAKCVGEANANGQLSATDAERMLVFCNAAGPAFLFGITGNVFTEAWIPWVLWGIHLFSAFCTAHLFPHGHETYTVKAQPKDTGVIQNFRQSLRVMGEICGWIILMRILISILDQWLLWYLPHALQIFIRGLLELSNGCISLIQIHNGGLRFIICSVFLGFGGLCVALQTGSAATNVKQHYYIPGKILQATISFLVAYFVQYFAFGMEQHAPLHWAFPAITTLTLGISVYFLRKKKKSCGISECIGV